MLYSWLTLWMSVLVLSLTCNEGNQKVSAFAVYQTFPWVDNSGKLLGYDKDSMLVFQRDDLVAYRMSYRIDTLDVRMVSGRKSTALKTHWLYQYFIKKKSEAFGYLIDSARMERNGWYTADSIFSKDGFWINAESFYYFYRDNSLLLESKESLQTGNKVEIYQVRSPSEPSYRATLYLEFSEAMKEVGFSLSRQLDSIRNMKLVKTRVLNERRFLPTHKIYIDGFTSHEYELKELPFAKTDPQIESYFRTYLDERAKKL